MPVREAKGRMLSREYMADRDFMTAYTPAEREWYLLTAMFADDAGYLPWDLPDNAANLYRYESPDEREPRVAGHVEHYTAAGRFIDLGCGHALMPSVAKHPRGRAREYAVRDQHAGCITGAPAVHPRALPSVPVQSVPLRARAREAQPPGGGTEAPPPSAPAGGDPIRDALRVALGREPGRGDMTIARRDARRHGQAAYLAALEACTGAADPLAATRALLRQPSPPATNPTNGHDATGPLSWPGIGSPALADGRRRRAIEGLLEGSMTEAVAEPYLRPGDLEHTRRGEWPRDFRHSAKERS
jgi:hypothetical protein